MKNFILKLSLIFLLFLIGCTPSAQKDTEIEDCNPQITSNACNFTLLNQAGQYTELYDYYGKNIVIDFSTEWCSWCQVAAEDVSELSDEYDIVYITILIENMYGMDPELSDLIEWSAYFNVNEPVLGGSRSMLGTDWEVQGWPTFYFINEEMVIVNKMQGYNANLLEVQIKALVAE